MPYDGGRLTSARRRRRSGGVRSEATKLLSAWADSNGGLAFDFTDITASQPYGSGKIIDGATPANNWQTTTALTPFDKLTWTGASLRMCYGSDGVLRYAPHNLILQSQTLQTSWGLSFATVSANAVAAPDGTTTADKIVEDSTNNVHTIFQSVTTSAGQHSFSGYFKAAERSWVLLYNITYGGGKTFDLTNGVVGSTIDIAPSDATIENVGNGWFRCTITLNASAASSSWRIYLASGTSTTSYQGDGTSGIYAWGLQLQALPVHSTDYIATTSSAVYRPRIDYDPSTLAVRGLLVEEARTNSCLYSQEFNTTRKSGSSAITFTENTDVAPDGTTTADTATPTGAGAFVRNATVTISNDGATHSYSIFIKSRASSNTCRLSCLLTGGTDVTVNDDLNLSVPSATLGTLTSVGGGWYRYTHKITNNSTGNTSLIFDIRPDNTGNSQPVVIWGAQIELNASFATSYIPTTSASATRAADTVSLATSAFNYNQTAVTLYVSASQASADVMDWLNLDNGLAESLAIYQGSTDVTGWVRDGGANQAVMPVSSAASTATKKIALGATTDSFATVLNGGTPATDSLGTMPTATTLKIAGAVVSAATKNIHIRQVMHLPQRLSNANLQVLTT